MTVDDVRKLQIKVSLLEEENLIFKKAISIFTNVKAE